MRLALVFAVTLGIVFCSPVVANVLTLGDLAGTDLSITSGDKLFDQFTYLATGDMPLAKDVNVVGFTDPYGHHGIRFQGAFGDTQFSPKGSDALVTFRVTVLNPHWKISDAHIYGNPSVTGEGEMKVTETFTPDVPNQLMTIHHISPGNGPQLVDSVYFDNLYTVLHVQKNIHAYAFGVGSSATLSHVDQTFSQVAVPEPSSVVILLTGLALLGCFVRCRQR